MCGRTQIISQTTRSLLLAALRGASSDTLCGVSAPGGDALNEVPARVAHRTKPYDPNPGPAVLTQARAMLCQMVMDAVHSPNTRRNYQKALADLFGFSAGRPLTRRLLFEYRATLDHLAPVTVNVRLSAIREMIGEAKRNGMIGSEEAANLTDIPNHWQKGTRMGNWLNKGQAWNRFLGRRGKDRRRTPDLHRLEGRQGGRRVVRLGHLVGCRTSPPNRSASNTSGLTTSAAPAPSSAAKPEEISNRSSSCSGTRRSRRPNGISAPIRRSPLRSMTVWGFNLVFRHGWQCVSSADDGRDCDHMIGAGAVAHA